MSAQNIQLTVVYDNHAQRDDLQSAHGFACLIDGLEKTILFDTGGDGEILLQNLEKLGRSPDEVDLVFLSHSHWDHTGGTFRFLHRKPNVTVYMPVSVSKVFREHCKMLGAKAVAVEEPTEIFAGVYSTGQLGGPELRLDMHEHALVLDTGPTISVITGCAHPGIGNIVARAKALHGKPLGLVAGGFHLMNSTPPEVEGVIETLRGLGVTRVATSHCTGNASVERIRQSWGKEFVNFSCGATVQIDLPQCTK